MQLRTDRRTDGPTDGKKRQAASVQLPLLSVSPSARLPVLDHRQRGTDFIGLSVRSVLNSPASTGMKFWSLNPYVGCEFGCSYCYARDTHKWVTERTEGRNDGLAERRNDGTTGGLIDEDFPSFRPSVFPPFLT